MDKQLLVHELFKCQHYFHPDCKTKQTFFNSGCEAFVIGGKMPRLCFALFGSHSVPPFFDLRLFFNTQYSVFNIQSLMATPGTSGSSNNSPRWGGTGDPGTAFSGLSRGRGRGRGAGGRGRGRARGGLSKVDIPSTKPDNSQSSASPSTKSSSLSTTP